MPDKIETPCVQCPWRRSNQGKRHPGSFYTRANLTRLWNQIRKGGAGQSCHLTDTRNPAHIAAGAKDVGEIRECPGAVVLVLREARAMQGSAKIVGKEEVAAYLASRKRGLNRGGILYWIISRIAMANVPFVGGPALPNVDVDDQAIGLPSYLQSG